MSTNVPDEIKGVSENQVPAAAATKVEAVVEKADIAGWFAALPAETSEKLAEAFARGLEKRGGSGRISALLGVMGDALTAAAVDLPKGISAKDVLAAGVLNGLGGIVLDAEKRLYTLPEKLAARKAAAAVEEAPATFPAAVPVTEAANGVVQAKATEQGPKPAEKSPEAKAEAALNQLRRIAAGVLVASEGTMNDRWSPGKLMGVLERHVRASGHKKLRKLLESGALDDNETVFWVGHMHKYMSLRTHAAWVMDEMYGPLRGEARSVQSDFLRQGAKNKQREAYKAKEKALQAEAQQKKGRVGATRPVARPVGGAPVQRKKQRDIGAQNTGAQKQDAIASKGELSATEVRNLRIKELLGVRIEERTLPQAIEYLDLRDRQIETLYNAGASRGDLENTERAAQLMMDVLIESAALAQEMASMYDHFTRPPNHLELTDVVHLRRGVFRRMFEDGGRLAWLQDNAREVLGQRLFKNKESKLYRAFNDIGFFLNDYRRRFPLLYRNREVSEVVEKGRRARRAGGRDKTVVPADTQTVQEGPKALVTSLTAESALLITVLDKDNAGVQLETALKVLRDLLGHKADPNNLDAADKARLFATLKYTTDAVALVTPENPALKQLIMINKLLAKPTSTIPPAAALNKILDALRSTSS